MRLTNRPCATCKVDTLHNGPTCRTCGTIAEVASVTLQRRYAAMTMPERAKLRRVHSLAKFKARKSGIGPTREAPISGGGVWGRGRARTKV